MCLTFLHIVNVVYVIRGIALQEVHSPGFWK